jgi:hypothetical protein
MSTQIKQAVQRYKQPWHGDCIAYNVLCSCGETVGGWTPEQADKAFEEHVCVQKKKPKRTKKAK